VDEAHAVLVVGSMVPFGNYDRDTVTNSPVRWGRS